MKPLHHPLLGFRHEHRRPCSSPSPSGFLRRWFWANSLIGGALALGWLLLRSGTKPSRFAYPCQQAALSAATLAFGGAAVSAALALRRCIVSGLRSPGGIVLATAGLLLSIGLWSYFTAAADAPGPKLDAPRAYHAQVYHVTDCPQAPAGDRFAGLDNLISLMGRSGLKLYRSTNTSLLSSPAGIISPDDVVVIKINYQWPERGGTNVDVLRGLIRRLVDHPDGFTGEIVVCENAQFNPVDNFDRAANNAQDTALSPHDVALSFQTQGWRVSHYDWTAIRNSSVTEFSAGNMNNGYVVYAYDGAFQGRLSYPKFQTSYGTYISLKNGIWSATGGGYDRARLKLVNLPVLKSHHAVYGATACVKNFMGVVTTALSTNSHAAVRYGILGALMGEVRPPDLNILDCIWINANPYDGPWTTYGGATRRDELVGGADPVAIDAWAVKNILVPAFIANGYSPPWPVPSADPDDPAGAFRTYLDSSMSRLLAAGYTVTNNPDQIVVTTWNGAGDFDGDSDVDLDDFAAFDECSTGPGNLAPSGCAGFDFDHDGDVDGRDFGPFQNAFTGR